MSDIFVSYAREDRLFVGRLIGQLEKSGWSVWCDDRLRPGEPFDSVIEHAVDEARIVVVIWSKHSVNSVWVKAEATAAQHANKLVPVLVDSVRIPMPFGAFHTADLTSWDGSEADPNLLALLRSLLDRRGEDGDPESVASDPSERKMGSVEWRATLLAREPSSRRFSLQIGTRRHDLECHFRPNFLWNRFVVMVDGVEISKGGHQYRDKITLDFPLGDDWVGSVQLGSGKQYQHG